MVISYKVSYVPHTCLHKCLAPCTLQKLCRKYTYVEYSEWCIVYCSFLRSFGKVHGATHLWRQVWGALSIYRVILLTGPPLFNVQCYYEKSQLANQRLSQMKWMDIQLSSPSNHLHTFVIMPLFGSSLNIKNWFEKFSVFPTKRKAYNWFCSFCPGTKGES